MRCRGAEIPQIWLFIARQEAEAAHLVPLPFTDLRAGDVADIVHVKEEKRAQPGLLQRVFGARDTITAEAIMVDAALEIHRHVPERRQVTVPTPAWINIPRLQDAGL